MMLLFVSNVVIVLGWDGFNESDIFLAVAISRNAASQGEGQRKGRNEVLHHEANEWFKGERLEGAVYSIYLPGLNSGV